MIISEWKKITTETVKCYNIPFDSSFNLTPTKRLLYLQNGSHAAAFEQLGNAMAFDPNNSKAVLAAGSVGMYF